MLIGNSLASSNLIEGTKSSESSDKLEEELGELDEALQGKDMGAIEEEYGDVLFTLVNLGRHIQIDGESALRTATQRFEKRFRALETTLSQQGKNMYETDPDILESTWRDLKGKDQ